MTPARSGVWKDLVGTGSIEEADYFAVIDYLPREYLKTVDQSKCVFLGAHPETMQAYRNMDEYRGLKMYDARKTFGFGEWWIKYDYDYLKALKPPTKNNQMGCIMSNADSQSYHKIRLEWLKRFCSELPQNQEFNLYGRIVPSSSAVNKYYRGVCGSSDARGAASADGNDHMSGKESVYEQHKYMIEFDATGQNYFSERVFDCMLLWSMPIYWGGTGLHKYLPENSFRYLNINADIKSVLNIANSNYYEDNIESLAKARNLLLDKYQIWARVHEAIYGEN